MRGFPPIHLMLLAIAFALVAVPLVQLTGKGAAMAETMAAGRQTEQSLDEHPGGAHVHEVPVQIRLRFAHRPERVSLKVGETELLRALVWSETQAVAEVTLEIGQAGEEYLLEAAWPEGTPETAVTVEIEPDGLDTKSETRWSEEGEVSDMLTFHWRS
jgi:hypothetical protein